MAIAELNNIGVLAEAAHYWAAQQNLWAIRTALTLAEDSERWVREWKLVLQGYLF